MKICCEICGGDLIKEGQFFVCQKCGCKYLPEDIKRQIDLDETPSGNDNSDKLSTYLELISEEVAARNFKTALEYCDKALDIDLRCSPVWYQKGVITLSLDNLSEEVYKNAFSAFANALNYCQPSQREEMEKTLIHFLQDFQEEHISKALNKYGNSLSQVDATSAFTSFLVFSVFNGNYIKERLGISTNTDEFYMSAWENIHDIISRIWKEQLHDPAEKLSTYDGTRWNFLENLVIPFSLIGATIPIHLSDERFSEPQAYYKRRVKILDSMANMEDYLVANWGVVKEFQDKFKALASIPARELSKKFTEAQAQIDAEKKAKKIEQYWEANSDEKQLLLQMSSKLKEENALLQSQMETIENEIKNLPEKKRMEVLSDEIMSKRMRIDSLGFFRKKEKQQLGEEILELKAEYDALEAVQKAKEQDLNKRLAPIRAEIRNNDMKKGKILARLADPINSEQIKEL